MTDVILKTEETEEKKPNNTKKGLVLLIVGVIILVAIVAFLVYTIFVFPNGKSWYAVFLTNGRSYFGHIVKQNSQTIVLRDVYYLQVQQVPATEEGKEPQTQLSLVNIADELHSPESEMQINRNQILYTQKLKDSSQVVTNIEKQAK